MKGATSLRTRLLLSFIIASLIPLLAASGIAVPWFTRSIRDQATRTLNTQATIADEMYMHRVATNNTRAAIAARSFDNGAVSGDEIVNELKRQAVGIDNGFLMWIDRDGTAQTSTQASAHKSAWSQLLGVARSAEATSFVSIMPQEELEQLRLSSRTAVELKETEGGSAEPAEVSGALSLVSVRPVTDRTGAWIGSVAVVDVFKQNYGLVDEITSRLGGVATVFQNGVRISTTVKNDEGARAIGTAVSDKVRRAVLDGGRPYVGKAFVVNREYLTSYSPLRDPSGAIVGMLFVGIDSTPFDNSVRNFALTMIGVTALGLVVAIVLGRVASTAFAAPLVAISDAAERIAAGDLSASVPERSFAEARAMGGAFNRMTESLRHLIGQVGHSSGKLDSVAREIASASSVEADSATSQASAVAEATATLEEINRSFGAVADGARRVLEIAEDSLAVAETGRGTVETGAGQVERLASSTSGVLDAAERLAEVADDIGQVTFVIGSIAEQTKILALNAAIEAARAGEAGKGFGVVASEIRTLADSVSTSVGRIAGLVRGIQDSSAALSQTAEQQASVAQETVVQTMQTRDSLDAIYDRMDRTAVAAREIATAAAQQQAAARSIVEVMTQVSQGVSGTAASARQLAEAAGDIEREAGTLSSSLSGFKRS